MAWILTARVAGRRRQHGASIVEVMVGILIGLIVVAVVYNVLIVSEGFRRSTLGLADAQVTGQLSQFVLGRELANAGNGVMSGIDDFATCNQWQLRPLPVLIEDSVDGPAVGPRSDRITVFSGDSARIVHAVRTPSGAPPGPNYYRVFSPNGFRLPLTANERDWAMVMQATPGPSNCALIRIADVKQPDGVTAYPPAAEGGEVALQYTLEFGPAFAVDATSRIVNLGRNVSRQTYWVDSTPGAPPRPTMQLFARNDNPGLPPPAVSAPLASNIVLLKAQYGIDTNNDGIVDCWASATNNQCGNNVDYSHGNFVAANPVYVPAAGLPTGTAAFIRTIKAVRVAIVVRSEDVAKADAMNATLVGQSAWLFNCAANDATCQGRISINNGVLQDYGRYRIYEGTIPLRNSIWNNS